MYRFLLLISLSFWICLPIFTQQLFSTTDIRIYDVLLLAMMVVLFRSYRKPLAVFFREDISGKWLFRFACWATFTIVFTATWAVLYNILTYVLETVEYIFHFWGFLLFFAACRIVLKERKQCLALLDGFVLTGMIEAAVICLQSVGAVRNFWPDRWIHAYGDSFYCATLGPNRVMPGAVMIMLFAVGFSYARNVKVVGARRMWMGLIAAAVSIPALAVTGSRMSWTGMIVFLALSLVGPRTSIRRSLGSIAMMAVVGVILYAVMPQNLRARMSDTYDVRITNRVDYFSPDASLAGKFDAIQSDRTELWTAGFTAFKDRPWLIPLGGGFNSYRFAVGAVTWGASAHNMYITLIGETGLVGLYLYLRWLWGLWAESSALMQGKRPGETKRRRRPVYINPDSPPPDEPEAVAQTAVVPGGKMPRRFRPGDFRALVGALAFAMGAGELLYTYRPSFTLLGLFLTLAALMDHPAMVTGLTQAPAALAKRMPRRRTWTAFAESLPDGAAPAGDLPGVV